MNYVRKELNIILDLDKLDIGEKNYIMKKLKKALTFYTPDKMLEFIVYRFRDRPAIYDIAREERIKNDRK